MSDIMEQTNIAMQPLLPGERSEVGNTMPTNGSRGDMWAQQTPSIVSSIDHRDQQQQPRSMVRNLPIPAKRSWLSGVWRAVPSLSSFAGVWRKGWVAETCSCAFATLSLMGLIATLVAYRNKPIPDWPQLISINSIVSLFSLLMRASIGFVLAEGISQLKWQWFRKARKLEDMEGFDSASRSAWGSALLLVKFGSKKPYYIAALGAIITLMAPLTGFAAQQLVQLQDCLQPDRSAAVGIYKTNSFLKSGRRSGPLQTGIFGPMATAIEVGIIQPVEDLTSVLSHGCTTGNCTFASTAEASFVSLGINYACDDVTDQVQEYHLNGTRKTVEDGDLFWANLTGPSYPSYNVNTSSTIYQSTGLASNGFVMATGTHQKIGNSLETIWMIFRRSWREANYTAINCSIFPSINTYGVNIANTRMEERLLDSVPLGVGIFNGASHESGHRRATGNTLSNGVRKSCTQQPPTAYHSISEAWDAGWIAVAEWNVDAAPVGDPKNQMDLHDHWSYYPKECVWTFGYDSGYGIQQYLRTLFEGQVLRANGVSGDVTGPIHLRQLFLGGNMTIDTVRGLMKGLTTAMTTVVRLHGEEGPDWHAKGTMLYTATCMRIDWLWIIFPAVMIFLSAVFLALVGFDSHNVESERLWKSSLLATLFCEVDDEATHGAKPASKSSLEEIAKSTSVSLHRDSESLRLIAR